MLAIEMLPGGHGDALVVEYGSASKVHRLLIDAGTIFARDAVRNRLLEMPNTRYEAVVVTHVDEDHIGGMVPLLADGDLRQRIKDVWFNGYVHSKQGGNVLGPIDGERLTLAIRNGGYTWNDPFPGAISNTVGGPAVVPSQGDLPTFDLPGGARIYLLSPSGAMLKRMTSVWSDVVEAAHLVPGQGTDRPAHAFPPKHKPVKALPPELTPTAMQLLARATTKDSAPANGSSIAFILEFGGKRALLGADAHPAVLVPALQRASQMFGEPRVRIHLCKLPHHGSRANVTAELIGLIDSSKYLVSTNGDNFGHPDDAAMARVVLGSARPATIYCNYASDRTVPWKTHAEEVGAKFVLPGDGKTGLRVSA
jgi:beta-lactamase superfamily II metal-dependent hydrolase